MKRKRNNVPSKKGPDMYRCSSSISFKWAIVCLISSSLDKINAVFSSSPSISALGGGDVNRREDIRSLDEADTERREEVDEEEEDDGADDEEDEDTKSSFSVCASGIIINEKKKGQIQGEKTTSL